MNFQSDKFMQCSRRARILKFVDFFECWTIAAKISVLNYSSCFERIEADIIRFTASVDIIHISPKFPVNFVFYCKLTLIDEYSCNAR